MYGKMNKRHSLGKRGEAYAALFYRQRGAEIIAANVNYAVGEIDLIVREGDTYVFVEVKTRASDAYGVAEAVTARKAALRWLEGKPRCYVRFDVLALVDQGAEFEVTHYEGVEDGAW
ncbi:TPA: YraN family protein [Corynebacterium striatum]|nr:YraN family protein [Corynebacterium striatum]